MDIDHARNNAEVNIEPLTTTAVTETESVVGQLVIFIHDALLDSGFVATASAVPELPKDWPSKAAVLSVHYTAGDTETGRCVEVRFSVIGIHATVYGCLVGGRDVYRVAVNLRQLAGLFSSAEAKEVYELWRVVKDRLSLPLLIDFCIASGTALPSCFMSLPAELKVRIAECLPGVDVATVGCTCTELRLLSSDEDLWKRKYVEAFGEGGMPRGSWKSLYEQHALYWKRLLVGEMYQRRKLRLLVGDMYQRRRLLDEMYHRRKPFRFRNNIFPWNKPGRLPKFAAIGGGYAVFSDFNDLEPVLPRI